ncbi:MAG: PAS domain-containing protein [Phycisphaerae bacterium]
MSSQSPTIAVIAPAGAEEMLAIQASILDHLSDGVTATDVAGRITYVSPPVHALLGYRPEEMLAIQASILDHLSDGVTATDVAGRITYVSPSVHALLGYRPEERIGRPIEQAYQRAEMALERAPRCGCTWHDGRERWA